MSSPWVTLRDLDNGALEWEGPLEDLLAANGEDLLDADERRRVLAGQAVTVHWSVVQRADVRERGLSRAPGHHALVELLRDTQAPVAFLGRNLGTWSVDSMIIGSDVERWRRDSVLLRCSRPSGDPTVAQVIAARTTSPRRVLIAGSEQASAKAPHVWLVSMRGLVYVTPVLSRDPGVTKVAVSIEAHTSGTDGLRLRRRLLPYEVPA